MNVGPGTERFVIYCFLVSQLHHNRSMIERGFADEHELQPKKVGEMEELGKTQ